MTSLAVVAAGYAYRRSDGVYVIPISCVAPKIAICLGRTAPVGCPGRTRVDRAARTDSGRPALLGFPKLHTVCLKYPRLL